MDKPIETQEVNRSQSTRIRKITKKAGLAAGAAVVSAAAVFGGAPPVNAAGETPTPTASTTPTPSPDVFATRIAELQVTKTAAEREKAQKTQIANLEAEIKDAQSAPTATSTRPPTPEPSPTIPGPDATATANAIVLGAYGKELADAAVKIDASQQKTAVAGATQIAGKAQAMETAIAAASTPKEPPKTGGGVPGWLIAIPVLGGLAYGGYRLYRRFRP